MNKVFYAEKLFDQRWIEKRKAIMNRDGKKCVICQKDKENDDVKLIVHHRQYHFNKRLQKHVDPWEYNDDLLITLCESCHSRGHRLYEIPVKYI